MKKKVFIIILIVVLVGLITAGCIYAINKHNKNLDNGKEPENYIDTTIVATLTIDVNPSIEINLNSENIVVSVKPLNEDSKKYQQYINMKEQFSQLLKEKEMHLHQIKELSFDIREKNKKIDELLQTKDSTIRDLNLSLQDDEDILFYKKIDKGLRCIFVPFYENIFVCINLSKNLEKGKGENDIYNLSNYECKYILDLNSFDKELSKMIVDYSLIVIGKISKLTELEQSKNKFLNLPEDKQFFLVTLGKVDYVIGFPENELMFNNYVN